MKSRFGQVQKSFILFWSSLTHKHGRVERFGNKYVVAKIRKLRLKCKSGYRMGRWLGILLNFRTWNDTFLFFKEKLKLYFWDLIVELFLAVSFWSNVFWNSSYIYLHIEVSMLPIHKSVAWTEHKLCIGFGAPGRCDSVYRTKLSTILSSLRPSPSSLRLHPEIFFMATASRQFVRYRRLADFLGAFCSSLG